MALMEADILIDEKYLRAYRQIRPGDAERKLMFAVLLDAVQTYQKFVASKSFRGETLYKEAEAWFWDEDPDRVFSFANICDVIGLNPAFFRRGLRQLVMNQKKRVSRGRVVQIRPPANRIRKLTFSGGLDRLARERSQPD